MVYHHSTRQRPLGGRGIKLIEALFCLSYKPLDEQGDVEMNSYLTLHFIIINETDDDAVNDAVNETDDETDKKQMETEITDFNREMSKEERDYYGSEFDRER